MSQKKRSGRSPGNPAGRHRAKSSQLPEDEDCGVVWIKTEPTLDGSGYMVTLEASDDVAVTLTPDQAFRHAQGILAAAHRAAHDAAVLRQMTRGWEFPLQHAGHLIQSMRDDRPPLDPADTAPLFLEPGVAPADLRPFLIVHINGEPVGQWDVEQAKQHAMAVLSMAGVADLDSGYYRLLSTQGIEEHQARGAVDDLANYREEL
jgi:hypothetical protein